MFEMKAKSIIDAEDVERGRTDADFKKCIDAVTKHVFPRNALAIQKRWMRRWMRKPRELNVRQYVARITEIVSKFCLYPGYKTEMAMTDDEVADIVANSVPNLWESFWNV